MNESRPWICVLGLLVAGCDGDPSANPTQSNASTTQSAAEAPSDGNWSHGAGESLRFGLANAPMIELACPVRGTLLVNLPQTKPITSEERLSFGGGGEVITLVADISGDSARGGVSGTGPVPNTIDDMLTAGAGASYGATAVGPLPPVDAAMAGRFAAACRANPPAVPVRSACHMQDGSPIDVPPLRALGTEPFWNAEIDGRCVTYKTPEDLPGARVWTRWTASADGQIFVGSLNAKPFRLAVRPAPGCSDGMSDNRYPMAATLNVNREERRGCAAPR